MECEGVQERSDIRVRARRTTWLADRLAHLSDEDRERVEAALPALRRMLEPRP